MGVRHHVGPIGGRGRPLRAPALRGAQPGRFDLRDRILLPQSGLTLGAFPDAEIASVIASAINDWQVDVWLDRDDRWRGSIVVTSQDPERAAEEIRRRASDGRFVGVLMPLIYMQMGHRFYYPIYEDQDAGARGERPRDVRTRPRLNQNW